MKLNFNIFKISFNYIMYSNIVLGDLLTRKAATAKLEKYLIKQLY